MPVTRVASFAVAAILAVTMLRVAVLAWGEVELYVDEAQYWLWGQELAFGYFSKPPLVGWVIRASVEIGDSTAFWVRVPSPIAYGITAGLVWAAAARVWPPGPAAWSGVAFATLPGTGVLSLFISTDALLMPCVALALLALLALRHGPSDRWAVVLGLAFGLGLLAKYAMVYAIVLSGIAVVALPGFRMTVREAAIAAGIAGLLILPNLGWNVANGFITFAHTADNAGSEATIQWRWDNAGEFLVTQLIAFGPVFALAWFWVLVRAVPDLARGVRPALLLGSFPLILAIAVIAVIDEANGNWAAPAFVYGAVLVVPWLALRARVWLAIGLITNVALAGLIAVLPLMPERANLGGRNLFERAAGMEDFSDAVLSAAEDEGAAVMASGRAILAGLVWSGRGRDVAIYARAPRGLPSNHYELTRPVPEGLAPLVVVAREAPPACPDAQLLFAWDPGTGAFRKGGTAVFLAPSGCG